MPDREHRSLDAVLSADGTRLVVRRVGSGTPVVMLHGSGGGLGSWARVAEQLADEHELWLLARRGYGPSDRPGRVETFDDDVVDVRAVLAAAGGSAHLVGSSHGATIALHTAIAEVSGLRTLSLYEPPLFAAGPHLVPVLEEYRSRLATGDVAGATMLFLRRVARVPSSILAALADAAGDPDPQEATRSAVGSLHDLEAMAADSGDIRRWTNVRVPTLLMQGADTWDPMPTTMDELAAALPHVQRAIWTGQAHFATSTAPGLVADELRRFLRSHDQPAAGSALLGW